MGVNSLPKTVTRQRRGCDLNPGPSVPESSTLTTRLPSTKFLKWNVKDFDLRKGHNDEVQPVPGVAKICEFSKQEASS